MKQNIAMTEMKDTQIPTCEDLIATIQAHVRVLLAADACPQDVTFALAFVATDLGLQIAKEPANVYPVVLSGVVAAACAQKDVSTTKAASPNTDEQMAKERPLSSRLH